MTVEWRMCRVVSCGEEVDDDDNVAVDVGIGDDDVTVVVGDVAPGSTSAHVFCYRSARGEQSNC